MPKQKKTGELERMHFTGLTDRYSKKSDPLEGCYLCHRTGRDNTLIYCEYKGKDEALFRPGPLTIKKVGLDMKGVHISYNLCIECAMLFAVVKPVVKDYYPLKK